MINKIVGIAINEYDDPLLDDMDNCINDLNRIISILSSKYEFSDIEILSQKEQTTYRFLFNRLYELFINCLHDENILLIFAGHGEFNPILKTSYWLPSDARKGELSSWFDIGNLVNFIRASKVFHVGLISDSCFSGTIFEAKFRGGGVIAIEGKRSRLALTSGGNEKVSDGKKGEGSPFANLLVSLLEKNNKIDLPFCNLSNEIILHFNPRFKQTPMAGSLVDVGHEGGSFIFKIKDKAAPELTKERYREVNLPLDLGIELNISDQCLIPLFIENSSYSHEFINAFVQQLAYKIISDTRSYFKSELDFLSKRNIDRGYEINITYEVGLFNDNFLSLTISSYDDFGGAHPNHYVHSLNFAFAPDRIVSLDDIINSEGYMDITNWVRAMIDKYGDDDELKDILNNCIEDSFSARELDFFINKGNITLLFVNRLPHAFKGGGYLSIPTKDINFRTSAIFA